MCAECFRYEVRWAINKYNRRVAKQIADYMGFPEDEILTIINLMEDNRTAFLEDEDND